jgi:hypothetical protein
VWTPFHLLHRTGLYRVRVRWVPVITASMYTADKGWPCSWMVGERSNGSSFYQNNMLQQILFGGLRIILKRIKNFFFDSVIAAILICFSYILVIHCRNRHMKA